MSNTSQSSAIGFNKLHQQIAQALQAAQQLKSTTAMARFQVIAAHDTLAETIFVALDQHTQSVIALCTTWEQRNEVPTENSVIQLLAWVKRATATLQPPNQPTVAQLQTISTALATSNRAIQTSMQLVQQTNTSFQTLYAALQGDSQSVAAMLQADQKSYEKLQARIAQYNRDHAVNAKHVCEEFGKSLITFGGWGIADAIDAKNEADRLNNDLHRLNAEMPALDSVEHPISALMQSLQTVEGTMGNLVAAIEEADNALSVAITTRQNLPNADDSYFQDAVNTLIADLATVEQRAHAIVRTEAVCGGYLFLKSTNLKWVDVPDQDLQNTFSPPLSTAQINEFKWWSQAVGRWGMQQTDNQGNTYLTAIPTYEVGNHHGVTVKGVLLLPRSLGAIWKDAPDEALFNTFPAGFMNAQLLNEPRYWAAAANRWAIQQVDPTTNRPFAFGLPTWEVGNSNGQPVRGVFLFPADRGIIWQDIPILELASTFDPSLPLTQLTQVRYWGAATMRWAMNDPQQRYACGVPSWEVGSVSI